MGTAPGPVRVLLVVGEGPDAGLAEALGAQRTDALHALLRRRARHWASAAFPDASADELDGGLGDAVASLLAEGRPSPGDVVIAAAELAAWRPDLGAAALSDLRAGCALAFGPVFDGGLYLLALSPVALTSLRAAPELDLGGRTAMMSLVTLAEQTGIEVGMLCSERGLRGLDDVRARLVDPLTDDELRAVLE